MSPRIPFPLPLALACLAGGTALTSSCSSANAARAGEASDAAQQVYVAPGKYDEFYAFMSGGFDGQVGIYGLPSGRLLKHVPVFSQSAEQGWGYSEQTKPMLMTS
jgi:nitrous-oxide reductase